MTESQKKCQCCSKPATETCLECGGKFCDVHIHTRRMHEPVSVLEFTPTEGDKDFIRGIMHGLGVGGTWAYKNLPLIFQKTDDVTLSCVAGWMDLFPGIEDEILKTKKTLEAAGFKFKDIRHGKDGDPSNPISPDDRERGGGQP